MSILLTHSLTKALVNEVDKRGQTHFFEDVPGFEEIYELSPVANVCWMTSNKRLQKLIVMEDGPTSITLVSKDLEGGDIWSLCLPKEDQRNDDEVRRMTFVDVIHDFTDSEEYSSSSDDYEDDEYACSYDEPDPEEAAAALAERYGVSQEDDE